MADKVQKIREEVERLMYGFNLEADIASCEDAETEKFANIKYQLCKKILDHIDKVQEEPVSEDLYEAATKYAEKKCFLENAVFTDGEMLIAKAKQRFDFYNLATAFEDGANWQKERVLKAMDLGEPPYLISVEKAYYDVKKLLEG